MSTRRLNAALLGALAVVLVLALLLVPDHRRPNYEFLPDMFRQARFDAFSPCIYFPDGKTLREPVVGTVARGKIPLSYDASPDAAERAGRELVNPIPEDHRKIAERRGKEVFLRFCVPCHGDHGTGDGPVALRGFPPPASLLAPKAKQLADGRIFHVLTYGQGNMPSYATQITREDRWNVILFVRSLQAQPQEAQSTPK